MASKRRKSKAKSRKKTTRKSKAKSRKKTTKSRRKPFGGYTIKFSGRQETLEQVFGKQPVTPSQMTKKIWVFIKSKRLANK